MTALAAHTRFRKERSTTIWKPHQTGPQLKATRPPLIHVRLREQKVISSILVPPWMEPSSLVEHIIHLRPKTGKSVHVCLKKAT